MIKEKGITLIALVITILIIITLAVITLNFAFGQDGILKKATDAKDLTMSATEDENKGLGEAVDYIDSIINQNNQKISSLFMWSTSGIRYSDLQEIKDYLNLNTIYIEADSEQIFEQSIELMTDFSNRNDIDLYILTGNKWGLEEVEKDKVKELLDNIDKFNDESKNKITGLSLDLEFYLLDEYKNGTEEEKLALFDKFVSTMKEIYEYAKTKNLKFVTCIPSWLNKLNEEKLEELIREGCDYVQVMNYTKDGMLDNISEEVEIAKKYNKKIENIAELQIPNDYNGVTDAETFYNDGIEACLEAFKQIEEKYQYSNLGYSYHYYVPIVELVGRVKDLTNHYDLELYTHDKKDVYVRIENAYLIDEDGVKHYGMPAHLDSDNQDILLFYGLELGKEYQLVIEDENYEGTKTFMYTEVEDKKEYSSISLAQKGTYKLELYGWCGDEEVSITSGKLINGDKVIVGKITEASSSDGISRINIVIFSELEYGVQYTPEFEAEGYTLEEGQAFMYDDKNQKAFYDDIYFVKNQ